MQVDGKAVLITGCDSGFGHALAKHLHKLGFTVFAGCLLKVMTQLFMQCVTHFNLCFATLETVKGNIFHKSLASRSYIVSEHLQLILNIFMMFIKMHLTHLYSCNYIQASSQRVCVL